MFIFFGRSPSPLNSGPPRFIRNWVSDPSYLAERTQWPSLVQVATGWGVTQTELRKLTSRRRTISRYSDLKTADVTISNNRLFWCGFSSNELYTFRLA